MGGVLLKYRRLGRSGLKVSEVSLGSWLTYGTTVEEETATEIIHRAYELGVNFFDSANIYGRGRAEKVMAKALKAFPRESYVITTKAWGVMGDGPNDRGLSRKHLMEQVHNSLKRMELDYIDVFYCHRYDPETPVEETLRALDDLVRQGKILYIGVSEWSAAQIEEAVRIADQFLLERIVVNQPLYNMLERRIEKEVIPVSKKYGIGQVVYSPLAQGVLTGKYLGQKIPEDSRAANDEINHGIKHLLRADVLQKVAQLDELAKEIGTTLPVLAIAWVLREPNVSSALVGASKPEQIEMNVKATELELTEDILKRIEEILEPKE